MDYADNPLLNWTGPLGTPALDCIKAQHFEPALEIAFRDRSDALHAIVTSPEPASFENTILPLERSGRALERIRAIFDILVQTNASEPLRAIHRKLSPAISALQSATYDSSALFARISALYDKRALHTDDAEKSRLIERHYVELLRSGARLRPESRHRLEEINRQLAILQVAFSQNLFSDARRVVFPLQEHQLEGLPTAARTSACALAREHGLEAPYAVVLTQSGIAPFMMFAEDRAIRRALYHAWIYRGNNNNGYNNKSIVNEILTLRAALAKLLGYEDYASLQLSDRMAGNVDRVRTFLREIRVASYKRALWERDQLQALATAEGDNIELAPWDWRFYARKLREQVYDFNEKDLMPYLALDNIIRAAFHTAERLFNLSFIERHDIPVYHPDVRVWQVSRGNTVLGLYYGDFYARASKAEGAWMSALRCQERMDGPVIPLILNNFNFAKSVPMLLSFEQARIIFHEFGHALHGLLSNVCYPSLAGVKVPLDCLEFPSKLYERWLEVPQVLASFATHYRTGEPLPAPLLERVLGAQTLGRGAQTLSTVVASILDIELHSVRDGAAVNADRIVADALKEMGAISAAPMDYRPESFRHIFSAGYGAGFYAYLWSDVLAADAYEAFRDDPFNHEWAARLQEQIYSVGGKRQTLEAYRDFRGHYPALEPFLRERNLMS